MNTDDEVLMARDSVKGVAGWLLVYIVGSIPILTVYSMGLSGWFFEYPIVLMLAIFIVLAIPLLLILMKSPRAPRWNITALWTAAVLMTLRSISVIVFPMSGEDDPPLRGEELLAVVQTLSVIVAVSLGWALAWTLYFKKSVRVGNTFR